MLSPGPLIFQNVSPVARATRRLSNYIAGPPLLRSLNADRSPRYAAVFDMLLIAMIL
jgi:hypothetical protein